MSEIRTLSLGRRLAWIRAASAFCDVSLREKGANSPASEPPYIAKCHTAARPAW